MVKKHALFAYFIFNIFSVHSVLFASDRFVALPSSPTKIQQKLESAGLGLFADKTGLAEKLDGNITPAALQAKINFASTIYSMQRENAGLPTEASQAIDKRKAKLLRVLTL